jgi:L-iditol 2-dehydrogenase
VFTGEHICKHSHQDWLQHELTSMQAARSGGKVMIIGMGTPIQTLPISAAALREVDLCGVFRYVNTYPAGIEIVSKSGPGYPDFEKLITHRFQGLESVAEAFELAGKKEDGNGKLVLKVLIEVGEKEGSARE